ncbi:MAG: autotransporter outer membrane beta-barrel domain-containing protein [Dialister invisus]
MAELTIGGTYNLSPVSRIYIDVTRGFGGDWKREWQLNAGFRCEF